MRLPVPQIPWGRANQFGDLMRVLKFRAVHFDYRAGISKEDLRRSLDNARLAGAGGPQEQQVSDWAPRRAQPGTEHLIELDKRLHGLLLPHDPLPQRMLKMARRRTPLSRVQLFPVGRLCCCCHDVSFTVVTWNQQNHDIGAFFSTTKAGCTNNAMVVAGSLNLHSALPRSTRGCMLGNS